MRGLKNARFDYRLEAVLMGLPAFLWYCSVGMIFASRDSHVLDHISLFWLVVLASVPFLTPILATFFGGDTDLRGQHPKIYYFILVPAMLPFLLVLFFVWMLVKTA